MAPRWHGLGLAVLLCAALLGLAGCAAGDGGGTGTPSGGTSSGGTSSGSQSSTTSGSTTTTDPPKRNIISWILSLGAGSPPGPASDYLLAYDALLDLDCEEALEQARSDQVQSVIEAAAMACLAATSGDDDLWDDARQRRDDLAEADLSCLDAGVYALLNRLLDAHAEHPDRTFEFAGGGDAGTPPCPTQLALDPPQGRAGDVVTLVGDHVEYVQGVMVVFGTDEPVCFEDAGTCFELDGASPTFTMPAPAPGETSARVVVWAAPAQWQMSTLVFEYVDDGTGTTTSTSTGTSTVDSSATPSATTTAP